MRAIADEFFAGEGARTETARTVFAVGDKKQSIFSFQRADPALGDRTRDRCNRVLKPFPNLGDRFSWIRRSAPQTQC